jgi:hypothetical protein
MNEISKRALQNFVFLVQSCVFLFRLAGVQYGIPDCFDAFRTPISSDDRGASALNSLL